jgi:OmpA-OmpF porin, OOP family
MKKISASLAVVCLLSLTAFSQSDDYVKRPALGVHFFFNDFKTASNIRTTSLSQTLRDKKFGKVKDMSPGLAVNYLQGISKTFDFSTTLAGSFLEYPIEGKAPFASDNFLMEADAMLHAKMLSDKYFFVPYLSGGIGASKYTGYFGAFIPVGAGIQVNLFDEAFLMINSQYRMKITSNTNYHFYHSIGFAGNIGAEKKVKALPPPPPPVVEPPKDTDGDGLVDSLDACPTEPGIVALNGCPDKDRDGIADKDDKCVEVAGIARYQGCPIPDTDADGVNDEEDKCKDVAGVARYQGCPVPDTDADGVNDEEDKCPTEKGPADNNGCPTLAQFNFNANNVQFVSGKSALTTKAKLELDKAAKILAEHPTLKISIEGHTDNTGKAATNQILSEKRAAAVKTYLVKKGVTEDRLTTAGFGADKPIADNKTAKGKAENRRVEFKTNN